METMKEPLPIGCESRGETETCARRGAKPR